MGGKVYLLLFASIIMMLFCQTTCNGPAVKVIFHVQDSTKYVIGNRIMCFKDSLKNGVCVSLHYERLNKREKAWCEVYTSNDTSDYSFVNFKILGRKVDYISSTYDKKVQRDTQGFYNHTFQVYIPIVDYNKLLKLDEFEFYFNDQVFSIDKKYWESVKEEIDKKQLMIYSPSKS